MSRPLVIVESPFGKRTDGTTASPDEIKRNVKYAQAALRDCLDRGEAPLASHLLYPQVYDDAKPEERKAGMEAGWAWMRRADLVVVYEDLGITPGMQEGMDRAAALHIPVQRRSVIFVSH